MKNLKSHTETIKCTFSNSVHKLLNPNPVKDRDKWKVKKTELTNEEKIALFDQIIALDKDTSHLLGSYWYDRREKRRVKKRREKKLQENLQVK
jgi:hypothetical protein